MSGIESQVREAVERTILRRIRMGLPSAWVSTGEVYEAYKQAGGLMSRTTVARWLHILKDDVLNHRRGEPMRPGSIFIVLGNTDFWQVNKEDR